MTNYSAINFHSNKLLYRRRASGRVTIQSGNILSRSKVHFFYQALLGGFSLKTKPPYILQLHFWGDFNDFRVNHTHMFSPDCEQGAVMSLHGQFIPNRIVDAWSVASKGTRRIGYGTAFVTHSNSSRQEPVGTIVNPSLALSSFLTSL